MKVINCIQGTHDWLEARLGRVTASRINDVMSYKKTGDKGETQKRADYKLELVTEILTGLVTERYKSPEMQWGTDTEPLARTAYEMHYGVDVDQVGFVLHPYIEAAGSSPDGLVGKVGGIECKCPNTDTHLGWLRAGDIPEEHRNQMLFNLRCTGRAWWDFVSFDPRLPKRFQLFVRRMEADDSAKLQMNFIDSEAKKFLGEVDAIIAELESKFPQIEEPREGLGDLAITDADLRLLV